MVRSLVVGEGRLAQIERASHPVGSPMSLARCFVVPPRAASQRLQGGGRAQAGRAAARQVQGAAARRVHGPLVAAGRRAARGRGGCRARMRDELPRGRRQDGTHARALGDAPRRRGDAPLVLRQDSARQGGAGEEAPRDARGGRPYMAHGYHDQRVRTTVDALPPPLASLPSPLSSIRHSWRARTTRPSSI